MIFIVPLWLEKDDADMGMDLPALLPAGKPAGRLPRECARDDEYRLRGQSLQGLFVFDLLDLFFELGDFFFEKILVSSTAAIEQDDDEQDRGEGDERVDD